MGFRNGCIGFLIALSAVLIVPPSTAATANITDGWGFPHQVSPYGVDAIEASIASNDAGDSLVAWTQIRGTTRDLWAAFFNDSMGWSGSSLVASATAGNITQLSVALGDGRTGYVSWTLENGSRKDIWGCAYVQGYGWGVPALLEFDDSGPAQSGQAAIDRFGNATVVWEQSDGIRFNIWGARVEAGIASSPTKLDVEDLGDARDPRVSAGADGSVFVVWRQTNGTTFNIWSNRHGPSGGWAIASLIENDDAGNAVFPQVAADGKGGAVAVWAHGGGGGAPTTIRANRFDGQTGWSVPQVLDVNNSFSATRPSLAVNSRGDAIVTYLQSYGTGNDVWSTRQSVQGSWSTPIVVDTELATAGWPLAAIDESGNGVVAWTQAAGGHLDLWANSFVIGAGWVGARRIEGDNSRNASLVAAAGGSGGLFQCLWHQSTGLNEAVWVASYRAPDLVPPTLFISQPANNSVVYEGALTVAGSADIGSNVVINGFSVQPEANGSFEVSIALREGVSSLTVSAADEAGNSVVLEMEITYIPRWRSFEAALQDLSSALNVSRQDLFTALSNSNNSSAVAVALELQMSTMNESLNASLAALIELRDELNRTEGQLALALASEAALQNQWVTLGVGLSTANATIEAQGDNLTALQARLDSTEKDSHQMARVDEGLRTDLAALQNELALFRAVSVVTLLIGLAAVTLSFVRLRRGRNPPFSEL